jgi:cyclophilin family peptidyl-prolyl cis-trans isomerase
MKNKILGVVLLIAIGAAAYYFMQKKDNKMPDSAQQQTSQTENPVPPPVPAGEQEQVPDASNVPAKAIAKFDTSAGSFEITLDGKAAPKTVANFIKLANDGYYEGTTFHRIVDHFMIQGGDPNSKNDDPSDDGMGGPGYTIPAEIGLKHSVGAISMARLSDQVNPKKDSSGSQFFIVLEENPDNHAALDGQYSAFGYVTKGMDVVTKIGQTPVEPNPFTGETSLPLKPVTINKITITEVK